MHTAFRYGEIHRGGRLHVGGIRRKRSSTRTCVRCQLRQRGLALTVYRHICTPCSPYARAALPVSHAKRIQRASYREGVWICTTLPVSYDKRIAMRASYREGCVSIYTPPSLYESGCIHMAYLTGRGVHTGVPIGGCGCICALLPVSIMWRT
jgi:hypothetical protein